MTDNMMTMTYQSSQEDEIKKDKWLGEINSWKSKNSPPVTETNCASISVTPHLLKEGHSFEKILHMHLWSGPHAHPNTHTCTHTPEDTLRKSKPDIQTRALTRRHDL